MAVLARSRNMRALCTYEPTETRLVDASTKIGCRRSATAEDCTARPPSRDQRASCVLWRQFGYKRDTNTLPHEQ